MSMCLYLVGFLTGFVAWSLRKKTSEAPEAFYRRIFAATQQCKYGGTEKTDAQDPF